MQKCVVQDRPIRYFLIFLVVLLQACSKADDDSSPVAKTPSIGNTRCEADFSAFVAQNYATADATRGGRLYDAWWGSSASNAPTLDQAIWSSRQLNTANISSGADTWRCKECHGWDYKGKDGAYGKGSHFTGFTGIIAAKNDSELSLFCKIRDGQGINAKHQFNADKTNGVLNNAALLDITKFIKTSMIDVDIFIDPSSKTINNANLSNGETLFAQNCANSSCHGIDGAQNAEQPLPIMASDNPWEVLHKLQYGDPASIAMPSYRDANWDVANMADVIAYAQSKAPQPPTTSCITDFNNRNLADQVALQLPWAGGLLYDIWWSDPNAPPTSEHPLWSQRASTNTLGGADSWRCVQCHGWDYKGKDGAFGDTASPDYTGFPGIYAAASKSAAEVFCAIADGSNINAQHVFLKDANNANADGLDEATILKLTAFITAGNDNGFIDVSNYISAAGISNGNAGNGQTVYSNSCSICHGADGSQLYQNGETLGLLADQEAVEVMHKIRFGHPFAPLMPAFTNDDIQLSTAQIADVIAYAQQSLPNPATPTTELCSVASAQYVSANYATADAAKGGRLYDNWVNELAANPPAADHALWSTRAQNSATNTYYNNGSGVDSWRCKECHGWDYKGASGVYGDITNLHYTGFKGLFPLPSNASAISLFCAIRDGEGINASHQFSSANSGGALSDAAVLNITKFLIEGMIDTSTIVAANGQVSGDNVAGQTVYTSAANCSNSSCHGVDGLLNANGQSIGTLSLANPWEVLHKIRYGHPGSIMPSFSTLLTTTQITNVLAYAQADLPKSGSTSTTCHDQFVANNLAIKLSGMDAAEGGQYYDKWWLGIAANAPTTNHPLWAAQNTNSAQGPDTWRCKECHGWDYKGDLGAYGSGSVHYTGFPGILAAAGKPAADVFCAIKEGEGINALHKFNAANTNGILDENALLLLTQFITAQNDNAMKDPALYIDSNGKSLGDAQLGASLYSGKANCALCHGADGKLNVPVGLSLGDVAVENPWEVLHKIRFGNPGQIMPNFSKNGTTFELTDAEIKNVIAYAQTIPSATPGTTTTTPATCATDMANYVSTNMANVTASQGGALYDNWWAALGYADAQAPTSDHPLWVYADATNNSSGSATWQCKECHGWDYQGKDGNYGVGSSHYSGFPGVFAVRTKTPIEIFCAISQGTTAYPAHKFNAQNSLLTDIALVQLTKFITDTTYGVFDMSSYIDAQGNMINANVTAGQASFAECALCHGSDGTLLAAPRTLGTIANQNPWEMLHTIRYGHPGSNPAMPAYVASTSISASDMANIIAYAKTLPTTTGTTNPPVDTGKTQIILGAQLYDHWMQTKGVAAPASDNPLWATQNTNNRTGADTWRCKECHGWDYKGKDGQYAAGSTHYTGFKGVYTIGNDATKSETDVFNIVKYGLSGTIHAFGGLLSDSEIQALAKFIKQGLVDTDLYISPTTGAALNANLTNGQLQYVDSGDVNLVNNANCSACHGIDGTAINFGTTTAPISLGTAARSDPWEVLHKARFGQPASIMPSTEAKGLPLSTVTDVLGYIQSLPDIVPPSTQRPRADD